MIYCLDGLSLMLFKDGVNILISTLVRTLHGEVIIDYVYVSKT